MQLINRNHCVFTGAQDLEPIYSFKKFPIYMGCTDRPMSEDILADMNWQISRSSGSVQLNPLIPLEVLYSHGHNDAIGGIWAEHHVQFAEFLANYAPENVLEIGGANGVLYRNYLELKPNTRWTFLEPNPSAPTDPRVRVIRGFMNKDFKIEKGKWDAIVHSHVFEHIYEPLEFVAQISSSLQEGQYHIFALPNLAALLKRGFTNAMNFEHTVLIHEKFLEALLLQNQLEVVEKKYYRDDHSIFYATRKNAEVKPLPYPNLYDENKLLFQYFVDENLKVVRELNEKIKKATSPIYLFGGHIFSQFLIGFGLDVARVECILDNSPRKIGQRLYGTSLKVHSPKSLQGLGRCHVILRAANYNEEIKKDILGSINSQVDFWE